VAEGGTCSHKLIVVPQEGDLLDVRLDVAVADVLLQQPLPLRHIAAVE
jgi:hypothetical protein